MKRETTAKRLNKIMKDRELRQVDILTLTAPYCEQYNVKMNKSDISQYCSGKTEPNQDKLFILGLALGVSESWLMGLDVPMERITFHSSPDESSTKFVEFSKKGKNDLEDEISENVSKLNSDGKNNLLEYSKILLGNPAFIKSRNSYLEVQAAHERTDIAPTSEGKAHDDAIMDDDSEWE